MRQMQQYTPLRLFTETPILHAGPRRLVGVILITVAWRLERLSQAPIQGGLTLRCGALARLAV